jgi:acyl-CoA synthetase (AMP-forming)/AMP-acid ligase II
LSLPLTIPGVLAAAAAATPEKIAIENEDGSRLTYAELLNACRRAAAAFVAYGIKPGDKIAVWAPNSAPWIMATIGVQMVGGILVPLNTRLKGREAAYILNRSGSRMLFTVRDFLKTNYPALLEGEDLPKLERTIILDQSGTPGERWAAFVAEGEAVSYATVDGYSLHLRHHRQAQGRALDPCPDGDHVAFLGQGCGLGPGRQVSDRQSFLPFLRL